MKSLKVLSPFGPKIASTKIDKKLVNKINQEVDKIISNNILSKKYNYSKKLVGQVKQEIELPKNFINKYLKRFLEQKIKLFVKAATNKNIKKIKIKNLWVVNQFANEYNPVHYHDGHISGVGYLKIPNQLNKSLKKIKTNGTIDFIYGTKSFLNDSIYNRNPKSGDLILFPNYLMHTAYPFTVQGERRSFSFNAEIDENISNVFQH